jgi:RNA polymerase sigma-70 factor (ECF subfamily)
MDELEPPQPVERTTRDSAPKLDAERWVEEYGDVLFGFAAARVRDRVIAQDLVQETFLAAIKASENFAGRSTERSWLFGILRNKLVDYYRRQSRETALADLEPTLPEEEGAFARSGLSKDGWVTGLAPKPWETPDGTLVSKEFQEIFRGCLSRLPDKVAQVFLLREVDAVSSEEICKDLGVSPNNLWVMLHRARMGLRRCLAAHWFGGKRKDE